MIGELITFLALVPNLYGNNLKLQLILAHINIRTIAAKRLQVIGDSCRRLGSAPVKMKKVAQ